jgi:uncharacterized protein YjiS (DUF1127 family)
MSSNSKLAFAGRHPVDQLASFVSYVRGQVLLLASRAQYREELASLTERELRDLPFSHVEALAEARKPFWRE